MCIKRRIALIVIFIAAFNINMIFANNNLKFTHLTVEDGLSQSIVWTIRQDLEGYLWMGTDNGLSRYDGREFQIYLASKDEGSISGNRIRAIMTRQDGRLWIGSDNGIDEYIRSVDCFKKIELGNAKSKSVVSMIEDSRGNVWVGTRKGLYKLDGEGNLKTYDNESDIGNDIIWDLIEDKDGHVWAATERSGVYKIDVNTMEVASYNRSNSKITSNRITSIVEDGDHIWLGSDGNGLIKIDHDGKFKSQYEHDKNDPMSISDNSIKSLYIDSSKSLWIGTRNGGLNRLNRGEGSFDCFKNSIYNSESINSNNVRDIFEDSSGVIWIGTFNGIDKYIRNRDNFNHYRQDVFSQNSISSNFIRVIFESNDRKLWIGTDGGGLNRFDPLSDQFIKYMHDENDENSLSENIVISIAQDKDSNIWAGTDGGGLNLIKADGSVDRFNKENGKTISNFINFIYIDSSGTIWFRKGYMKVGEDRFSPYLEGLSKNVVYEDLENTIWIGTSDSGVYKYTYENYMFENYPLDDSIIDFMDVKGKGLYAISKDSIYRLEKGKAEFERLDQTGSGVKKIVGIIDGRMVMRSDNKLYIYDISQDGLSEYVGNGNFKHISIKSSIVDQDQNIWLGTTAGIFKISIEENRIIQYKKEDGLQGNEFNESSLASKDGFIYFGGNNGFNMIYPKRIRENANVPKIALTEVRKFDKRIYPKNGKIELEHNENFFSVEFASLEYTNPLENQYAYKLEGVDKNWVYSGNRNYALYTNISPGKYLLKVKGSNNEGVWSDEEKLLTIVIKPSPFESPVAYLFYLLIFVIGIKEILKEIKRNEKIRTERKIFKEIEEKNKELESLNKQLKKISCMDCLTDIANRREFDRIMELKLRESSLSKRSLGVMMIDIDSFKKYNDTYGHVKGDACIETIAKTLSENLRGDDFIARYGGEEFVIIVDGLSDENIVKLAEKLRLAVRSKSIDHLLSKEGIVTISIGITNIKNVDGLGAHEIVERADKALYRSKQRGRNMTSIDG